MKKLLLSKCLGFLSVALVALATATTATASIWIFQYQPKTPKSLIEKSH